MNVREIVPWFSQSGARSVDPFWVLHERMSRMFDETLAAQLAADAPQKARKEKDSSFAPKLSVSENTDAFSVSVELPGVSEKDLSVTVKDRVLTVSGERKSCHERGDGARGHYCESSFGSFRRSIKLGDDIRESQIEAVLKNGVLTVTLPKCPEAERAGRSIAVRAE